MRRALVAIAVALVLGASGCQLLPTADEAEATRLTNLHRYFTGVPVIDPNGALQLKARSWAQTMADRSGGVCSRSTIYHSNLSDGAPKGWRKLGENVGCHVGPGTPGEQLPALHQSFLASPSHRENIEDPAWTHAAHGLATTPAACCPGQIIVFEAQEFMAWG